MIGQISFIHMFLILIIGISGLIFLILAIRQFVSINFPIQRNDQIRRSIIIAGYSSIIFFFVVAFAGILVWINTGNYRSTVLVFPILCFAPFMFIISALGTYIQFYWYEKLYMKREDMIKKQADKY